MIRPCKRCVTADRSSLCSDFVEGHVAPLHSHGRSFFSVDAVFHHFVVTLVVVFDRVRPYRPRRSRVKSTLESTRQASEDIDIDRDSAISGSGSEIGSRSPSPRDRSRSRSPVRPHAVTPYHGLAPDVSVHRAERHQL